MNETMFQGVRYGSKNQFLCMRYTSLFLKVILELDASAKTLTVLKRCKKKCLKFLPPHEKFTNK